MNEPSPKPRKRVSRYQRIQQRREAQRQSRPALLQWDFGVIGACVLVVLGLAMIASSGEAPQLGGGSGSNLERQRSKRFSD